jgi:photosystem II stability/assembly factor-like uncharacterized protein
MNRRTSRTAAGLLATAMLYAVPAVAQDGPKFYLNATAVDPDDSAVVYTSDGSMWKSSDSGTTWAHLANRIVAWSIVVSSPDTETNPEAEKIMYAATQEDGVVWSTDDETWTAGNGLSGRVGAVAVHPDGDTVFAGAEEAIYVSRDRGRNWEVLSGDVGTGKTTGLAIDSANPLVMYAAKRGQGVYRSIDGGLSWQLGNSGLTDWVTYDLDLHPRNPSILFLATASGVFRSVDAGVNWEKLDTPTRATELAIDPTNPDRMIVTTAESGILRSLDGGESWQPINTGLGNVVAFVSIAIARDGSGMVYAGSSENGLFTSADYGDTWSQNYILPETEAPPPASPPPPPPTSLTVRIVNRNGEAVEFGETARFDVVVRNSGSSLAQNAQVRFNWEQVTKGPYAMTAHWSGGSCPDDTCNLGNLPVNGEVVISVEGRTGDAYNWVGPYSLLATVEADNAEWSSASIRVDVTRTIFSAESGGGASGPLALAILFLVALLQRMIRSAAPTSL